MEIQKLKQYNNAEYPKGKFQKVDISFLARAVKFTPAGLVPLVFASCFPRTVGEPASPYNYDSNLTMQSSINTLKINLDDKQVFCNNFLSEEKNIDNCQQGDDSLDDFLPQSVLGAAEVYLKDSVYQEQGPRAVLAVNTDYQKQEEHIQVFLNCLKSIGLI